MAIINGAINNLKPGHSIGFEDGSGLGGGSEDNSYKGNDLTLSINNLPTSTEFDVRPEGFSANGSNSIDLTSLKFTLSSKNTNRTITEIEIFIGTKLYKRFKPSYSFYGGDYVYTLESNHSHEDVFYTVSGEPQARMSVYYGEETKEGIYGIVRQDFDITKIRIFQAQVSKVYISPNSTHRTLFWDNEEFERFGLIVAGDYTFVLSGEKYKTTIFNSYSVSQMNLAELGHGEHTVTISVSYIGTTSYKIKVDSIKGEMDKTSNSLILSKYGKELDTSKFPLFAVHFYYHEDIWVQPYDISWKGFDKNDENGTTQKLIGEYVVPDYGKKATASVDVKVCTCERIYITKEPTKLDFKDTDVFNYDGLEVYGSFGEYGQTKIENSELVISEPDFNKHGSQTITITYKEGAREYNTSYKINVASSYVGLVLGENTGKREYWKHEVLDTSGVEVYVKKSDGSLDPTPIPHEALNITNDYNSEKVGTYTVTISYTLEGVTHETSYNVYVKTLSSIQVQEGYKDVFFINEQGEMPLFSEPNLTVKAFFEPEGERNLTDEEYTLNPALETRFSKVGKETITVSATFGDTKEDTYAVSVKEDYPIALGTKGIVAEENIVVTNGVSVKDLKAKIKVYCKTQGGSENLETPYTIEGYADEYVFGKPREDGQPQPTGNIEANINVKGIGNVGKVTFFYKVSTALEITKQPNNIRYIAGITIIDLTGIEANLVFNDNTKLPVTPTTGKSGVFSLEEANLNYQLEVKYGEQKANVTLKVVKVKGLVQKEVGDNSVYKFERGQKLNTSAWNISKVYTDDLEEKIERVSSFITNSASEINFLEPEEGKSYRTINIAYKGKDGEASLSLQIEVKALNSLVLYKNISGTSTEVKKIKVNYGEKVNLFDNYVLVATYNTENSVENIVLSSQNIVTKKIEFVDFTNNAPVQTYISTAKLKMYFGSTWVYTSAFEIDCKALKELKLVQSDKFSNKQWYIGEEFGLLGSTFKAIYGYASEADVEEVALTSEEVAVEPAMGYKFVQKNTLFTFTYEQGSGDTYQKKSLSMTISAEEVTCVRVTIDTLPSKPLDSYIEGNNLNLEGLKVIAHFNNGTTIPYEYNDVSLRFKIGDVSALFFNSELIYDYNNKNLYVYVLGMEPVLIGLLKVARRSVASISVESENAKTSFLVNDKFTTNGLAILINYDNGDKAEVTSGFTTSPFVEDYQFAKKDISLQTAVTVTFGGKSDTYNIKIEAPKIKTITFTPNTYLRSVKNGEQYSLNSLQVVANFENGFSEIVPKSNGANNGWTSDYMSVLGMVSESAPVSTTIGVKDITVTVPNPYDFSINSTGILQISVDPNGALTGIYVELVKEEDISSGAVLYKVGEKLNQKDIRVMATYKDIEGATETKNYITNPPIGSVFRKGGRQQIEVSLNADGILKQAYFMVDVSIPFDSKYSKTKTYKIVQNVNSITTKDGVVINEETLGFKLYAVYLSSMIKLDTEPTSPFYNKNVLIDMSKKNEAIGYLDLGKQDDYTGITTRNAHLVLFEDVKNPIQGTNNITIKFPHYNSENVKKIDRSTFGIMFGHNNSRNRLFISGNQEYPNRDWYSGQVNAEFVSDQQLVSGNFGYFEYDSETVYGETDNSIIGYDIVSDNKLLVLKTRSQRETSVYFRVPKLVTAINNAGEEVTSFEGKTLLNEVYSVIKGNNSTAGISPFAIANFNGDTLFLTNDKEIAGLNISGIIGDNQRYAVSRSTYINADLLNQDLSKAFLWTNNKYLFLVLKNKLYVTHRDLLNNGQYEWFVFDVANITSMTQIGDTVYLGTQTGRLERFKQGIYEDRLKFFVRNNAKIKSVDEKIYIEVPEDISKKFKDNVKYTVNIFDKSYTTPDVIEGMYYKVASIGNDNLVDFKIDAKNNVIRLVTSDLQKYKDISLELGERNNFYLDNLYENEDDTWFKNYYERPFRLKRVENVEELTISDTYEVYDFLNERVNVNMLYNARMSKKIVSKVDVVDIDKEQSMFRLALNGKPLDIIAYGNQTFQSLFQLEIVENRPVEAYYITAPMSMGTLEVFKTFWSYTLTNDVSMPSELELCYASNKIPYEELKSLASVSKEQLGFDLNDFDFSKIDFDKNIVPRTYTNKKVVSKVKFACFAFRNLNNTNSVLSSVTISYSTPCPSFGKE